jgi:CRP-like cAMP-binding protein
MTFPARDILKPLSSEEVDWVISNARQENLITAAVLLKQGTLTDSIYFIVDGLFEIFVCDANGREQWIGQCGPGEIVGETSWLNELPAVATVKSIENSTVLRLSTSILNQKLASDTTFALHFYKALARLQSKRLREAVPLIANLRRRMPTLKGILQRDDDVIRFLPRSARE